MVPAVAALIRQGPLNIAVWLIALALAFSHASNDIGYALANGSLSSSPATLLGRDFVNVYSAGQLVLQDNLASIYDVSWYQAYQSSSPLPAPVAGHNYSYPPISFFYVWLFALLPYGAAYFAWIAATGLAFAFAARPYLKEAGLSAALALLLPASIANVWAGHYGFLIAALWLAGWRLLEDRPRLAGILLGCLAIKPHIALLIPLVLAWRGSWISFRYAVYTVVGLVLGSGAIFGWSLWSAYVTDTLSFQASLLNRDGAFYMTMMPSIVPSLKLAGASSALAWAVQGAAALLTVAALLRWLPRDSAWAGLATAVATALVVPYSFNYDLVAVGVLAVVLLYALPRDAFLKRSLAAACLLLPLALPFLGPLGIPAGPILLALLLVLVLKDRLDESGPRPVSPKPTTAET